ncbi:MAG: LLM class F420-dependent oxidoreductase [Chloroflexi bacterium]|nr:LLM class F420-dependent oxidoreductase [Chloroflexota bacterium]MDA1270469.1 LLM class F420-dependent oxidoreductase [Chloroflexota bacterium]
MKIAYSLSNNQGIEDVQGVVQLAVRAEELGFESVWASEHVFNVSYVYDRIGDKPYYEPLTILTYVAALTKTIRLGTSVLVLPYHNPIRLAKRAATLDVLSGGRLMLGVGVGVIEEELEAMGSPHAERGAITDESIAIMKELWTNPDPSYQGKYHSFSGMKFTPKPVQKPHIPICIGGTSRAAIRRAARSGTAWHPTALSPEVLAQGMEYLKEQAEVAGRDPSEIAVSVSAAIGNTHNHNRYSLGEDPEEILERAHLYQEMGVERLLVSANTRDPGQLVPVMEMLAEVVIPSIQDR